MGSSGGRGNERGAPTVEGTVIEAMPNAMFRIELDNGQKVIGHMTGATRNRYVRVIPGDRVTVELAPLDLSRGRIVRKHR